MRITFLNQFYPPDLAPTGRLTASVAEHRAAAGDEVRVVASRGGYAADASTESNDNSAVKVHRVWTPQLGKASNLMRMIDYLSFYMMAMLRLATLPRQDVIVTLTTPPYIGFAAALHKLLHWKTKIVLWNMDCYPDVLEPVGMIKPGGMLSRVLRWLQRRLFTQVDQLVTLDGAMADLLLRQYAPRKRRLPVEVIPNWEPAQRFPLSLSELSPEQPKWKKVDELGLAGKFVVAYMGNAGYGHTFETALNAAADLQDAGVKFLFVGGGKRVEEIRQTVEQRSLTNVVLHPYVPEEDIASVMRTADCALITLADWSLGIMSPSKLHGNLAMGLPVIYVGPEGSNVDEAILRSNCGMSLRDGDVEGLVEFVKACQASPEKLTELKQHARAAFDAHYNDAVVLRRWDTLLESLV